jgi:transporter family protein
MCMLAGLSVLAADVFIIKAYKQGLPVSIGGPIVIGGGIVVVTLAGLLLGERMTVLKAVSILMILCGASILGSMPR